MSVFYKLEQRATGMRRENEFRRMPVAFTTELEQGLSVREATYSVQAEYALHLRLTSTFWANNAQVEDGRKHAERALANLLYEDVLHELDGIMHAISDGDARAALSRCGELIDSLKR